MIFFIKYFTYLQIFSAANSVTVSFQFSIYLVLGLEFLMKFQMNQ